MPRLIAYIAAAIVSIPLGSIAGIPTTAALTCPVGGERFEIVETLSCSSSGERSMSFAPISTCDFITRLPQCPHNFLPMYKEFTNDDLALLRPYMETESYDNLVDRSRYYLAYNIEKYIGENGTGTPFWLLLQGLWFDPENTFTDQSYMNDFFYESLSELRRVEEGELPYVKSILAFAYANTGNGNEAKRLISEVAESGENQFLNTYHRLIQACIANQSSEYCRPTTRLRAN